jgi:hypothetical protein
MDDLVIEDAASSELKITLGEFLVFIGWMTQIEKTLERSGTLPPMPELNSGKIKGWIQLVQRIEERFHRREKNTKPISSLKRRSLES